MNRVHPDMLPVVHFGNLCFDLGVMAKIQATAPPEPTIHQLEALEDSVVGFYIRAGFAHRVPVLPAEGSGVRDGQDLLHRLRVRYRWT